MRKNGSVPRINPDSKWRGAAGVLSLVISCVSGVSFTNMYVIGSGGFQSHGMMHSDCYCERANVDLDLDFTA